MTTERLRSGTAPDPATARRTELPSVGMGSAVLSPDFDAQWGTVTARIPQERFDLDRENPRKKLKLFDSPSLWELLMDVDLTDAKVTGHVVIGRRPP